MKTKKEYEKELQHLNEQCSAECEPLRKELLVLQAKKNAALGEIALLKAKIKEYGIQYNEYCTRINEIRLKYAEKKEFVELSTQVKKGE